MTIINTVANVTSGSSKHGFTTYRYIFAANANIHALPRDPSSPAALELKCLGAKIYTITLNDAIEFPN